MTCLRDWIELRWCGNDTSPSGVFINSYPGISFKQINALSDDEQGTFAQLWEDIKQVADASYLLAFNAEMARRYRLLSLKKLYNLNKELSTTTYLAGTHNSAGFTVKMFSEVEDYPTSLMSAIHGQQLFFYSNAGGSAVTVKIFDLSNGTVLFTHSFTSTLGWNTIEVNQTFHNNFSDNSISLYCCALTGALATTGKEVETLNIVHDCSLVFKGATSALTSGITDDDVDTGTNSYGLSGIFSSVCTWEALLCQNKNAATVSKAYHLAIEILNEQIYSDRYSKYTTIARDKAIQIREEYEMKFATAIKQFADGINLSLNDDCIECNELYTVSESHP